MQHRKIEGAKYSRFHMFDKATKFKNSTDKQKLMTGANYENFEKMNKYWLGGGEKSCGICNFEYDTLKHLVEE